jgi:transposase InsO family protein
MTLMMNDEGISGIEELKQVVKVSPGLSFQRKGKEETYQWIEKRLVRFRYGQISKSEKGLVKKYLGQMTGYCRAQITRLIARYRATGHVREWSYNRHRFPRRYTDRDIGMLAQTDKMHSYPNGAAVKRILGRMATTYGEREYETIAGISVAHIYNLRKSVCYRRSAKRYIKTRPVTVPLGQRRKPQPNGIPGYLRVDTMHQGDQGSQKGVYHINTVDEVTQSEFAGAVEKINEHFLTPLLLKLIESYPFIIREFHADNGSEYINRVVVKLLNKLLITLTKSRPRQLNDNALVETKNGWVLRKWVGYQFIDQKHAARLNEFYFGCFNEYVNFHRPCGFPTEKVDAKGRVKKLYPHQAYMTPYEKLKSIPNAAKYLKNNITFAILDRVAGSKSDNEMARLVQQQRDKLLDTVTAL